MNPYISDILAQPEVFAERSGPFRCNFLRRIRRDGNPGGALRRFTCSNRPNPTAQPLSWPAPLELVRPGFCALIFAGDPATAPLNRKLALEINENGGRAIWLDNRADPEIPTLAIPETGSLTRPVGEILPMELLTLAMAERKGITAGAFQLVDKITAIE